jgi:hypothetical protein
MLPEKQKDQQGYFRMEDARRLRRSAFWALDSATRLVRMAAYSFYGLLDTLEVDGRGSGTYSSILGPLRVTALQCNAVALVLKTLWSDQSLDLRGLGVWPLALTFWLDLTTDNKLADL